MEKIIKTTKEVEETHTYCDCCGKEFHWGICANSLHSCKMCTNVMCDDCRKDYPIDNEVTSWYDAYDENPYICKTCADMIVPFAEQFNNLWEKYLEDKDKIKQDFRKVRDKEEHYGNKNRR